MSLKEIFNQASRFQQNAGSTGLDLSAMPIKLQQSYTFETADDFNDGVKDPRWITAPLPSLFFQFIPNVSPNATVIGSANQRLAQTFKVSANKSVCRIGLRLSAYVAGMPPGEIVVEIRSTSGAAGSEVPTATVIATAYPKAANTLVGLFSPVPAYFTYLDFPQAAQLQAGVVYAIVVRQTVVNVNQGQVSLYGENNQAASYADGRALSSSDGGSNWSTIIYIKDFDFQLYEPMPNTQPTEAGCYLQFDYPTSTPVSLETVFNSPRGSIELETRFIWTILDPSLMQYTPLTWGIHLLQGAIQNPPMSDGEKDAKLLVEVIIRPSPMSNNLSFVPIIVDASGNKLCYLPSYSSWVGFSGQGGFFMTPTGAAAGVPVTIKVQRQQDGGVVILAYKNDNPSQVIFQTNPSPPVRALSGDIHLDAAHSPEAPGSRFRFDYFKLSGQIVEPDSGEVILRRSYPLKTKVTGWRMERVLPAPGSRINVRLRSADTLEALQAAAFGAPLAGTAVGNMETGEVNLPAALYFDVKLEFIKASPGPTLSSFDFTVAQQVVEDDQPIILTLDEAGPGLVRATSSEESGETANTRKLVNGDAETQWTSVSASDATPVTLELNFLASGGGLESRTFNAVIIRNTNIKALRVLSGTVLFDGEIGEDDVIIPFSQLTTPTVQIEARTTKTPNQNKKIGEVYVGRVLAVMSNFDSYEPKRTLVEAGSLRTLGGKLVAYRGKDKYFARWRVLLAEQATRDEVERVFKQNPLVTFWPEPKARPRDLFDVGWKAEALPLPYSEALKGAGFTIESEMEEI